MRHLPFPILAVETSAGATSVALWDGSTIHSTIETTPNQQAEKLVPMMQALLLQHNLTCEQLVGYATTIGPGSFTGIRIGLSALIGLQTVFPRPLYGPNTLEVAAYEAGLTEGGTVIREALRGQAYVQHFGTNFVPTCDVQLLDYAVIASDQRERCNPASQRVAGLDCNAPLAMTVISNCDAIAGKPLPVISAASILGLLTTRETAPLPKHEQKPLYIRPPDAKLPKARA